MECIYRAPVPSRPRKRLADEDLHSRLRDYEDLMKKHRINFEAPGNVWIQSGLEEQAKDAAASVPTNITQEPKLPMQQPVKQEATRADSLWAALSSDLRNPPFYSFTVEQTSSLSLEVDGVGETASMDAMRGLFPSSAPERDARALHPEPKHIFKLWQLFVDKVNPLTKIVHVPTLQQRIWDVIFDLDSAQPSLQAVMFAIYTVSIAALSTEECVQNFRETKAVLLERYRMGTLQSLTAANLLVTRDFEVVQAFSLFILSDPQSELCSTLLSLAVRLGQRVGLHRELGEPEPPIVPTEDGAATLASRIQRQNGPKLSLFETEMRIRLYWQLRSLDCRLRVHMAAPTCLWECGKNRLPLNVNDSDLHPDMTELPIEHVGPTEMLYVLTKYEVLHWVRSAGPCIQSLRSAPNMSAEALAALKEKRLLELQTIYENKYLARCDKRIPLHTLSAGMSRLTVAKVRFKVNHPRSGQKYGPSLYEATDLLFEDGVVILELGHEMRQMPFARYLFAYLTARPSVDAYIYVLSELRRRFKGDRVSAAWRQVERLYEEHPELVEDGSSTFYTALGDLTLEAWDARAEYMRRELGTDTEAPPGYILRLRTARAQKAGDEVSQPLTDMIGGFNMVGGGALDWDYWNDFLQL